MNLQKNSNYFSLDPVSEFLRKKKLTYLKRQVKLYFS